MDNGWISVGPVISKESFRVLPRDAKFSFLSFFLFFFNKIPSFISFVSENAKSWNEGTIRKETVNSKNE